jgi:TRAP-type C4-dicarboxylate transport system permease small subunit
MAMPHVSSVVKGKGGRYMRKVLTIFTNLMSIIAGVILLAMAGLTLADVIMRYFRKPIIGTYEVVAFLGVAVVAFSLPRASMTKTNVVVDLVIDKLPPRWRRACEICTRVMVFGMFLIGVWYFFNMAQNFVSTNTVTPTLRVPFYPVVYAMALSCFVQCLVSLLEIFDPRGGIHE